MLLSFLVAAVIVSLCIDSSYATDLNIHAWSGSSFPNAATFPEKATLDAKNLPSTALSFSGGGATAFNIAMGILSVLNSADLIKNIRYIGGVSGGAWAASVYTYAQNIKDDGVLLGPIVQPKDINDVTANTIDPACARIFTTRCFESCGFTQFLNPLKKVMLKKLGWILYIMCILAQLGYHQLPYSLIMHLPARLF